MSIVTAVTIGGWTTAFAMFAFFALSESGKLLRIRQSVASLLESAAAAVRDEVRANESLEASREDAA
jgi:hypothetical protein